MVTFILCDIADAHIGMERGHRVCIVLDERGAWLATCGDLAGAVANVYRQPKRDNFRWVLTHEGHERVTA